MHPLLVDEILAVGVAIVRSLAFGSRKRKAVRHVQEMAHNRAGV